MGRAWPLGVDVLSIAVMNAVWRDSLQKGSALLTLLAIADNANDQGNAWPSQETLAAKTRLSVSQIRRITQAIADGGELEITRKRNGRSTRIFYRVISPLQVATLSVDSPAQDERLTGESPFHSYERRTITKALEKTSSSPEGAEIVKIEPRRRDPVWDALAAMFGNPSSREGEKRRGKCRAALIAAGVTTADQVGQMAAEYRATFSPEIVITAEALSKHADQLLHRIRQRGEARAKAAHVFCEWCGHRDGAHADDCVRPRAVA